MENKEISSLHEVYIDGKSTTVRSCRVSALPFNIWWQGRQRPLDQTEEASFASFVSDGGNEIEVRVKKPFSSAVVRPLSAGITPTIDGDKVRFKIVRSGAYVLETDDEHNALHIFANPEEDFAKYSEPTVYFGAGVHETGIITLKSGDRVYLAPDAVVRGGFYAENASDVKIFGYGVVDDRDETRKSMHCYENYTNGCAKFYGCDNLTIDGVVFRDSAVWVVNLFDCENVTINNVKIVGHYRYNTDGIDVVNSRKVHITDSFVRSFDDAITLKGIIQYKDKNVEDILVENTVCWCGWGRTLEIGLETVAPEYKRITFRNCDLIHNSAVALDVQAGDYAEISDLTFENVRVEYQPYTLPEVVQNPPEKKYDGYGKRLVPKLFCAENPFYLINDPSYVWYDEELKKAREGKRGSLKRVTLDGVSVLGDAGGEIPAIRVELAPPFECGEIVVKNLSIFGKKVSGADECRTEGKDARFLRFE